MGTTLRTDTVLGGRYRLGPLLGSGGMADVYDAVDDRLGRPVAVKVLRPEMAVHPDVRRRFETEARAAARLSHPNAVAVFDTGVDGAIPWLVMERLPGETLADRMRVSGPMDPDWVRRLAGDVLGALGAAHAAGLVHRDIKPGNILIGADGCAKVADFGIAKSLEVDDDHTVTGQLVGTPAYVAPERIDGEPATARSDLYALGVVLYEALSGRKPFEGTTALGTAYAVRHTTPPPLEQLRPSLPRWLVDAVATSMAKDPARRFASANEMARALQSGMSGTDEPTVVFTPVRASRWPTVVARDRLAVIAGGALVVLLLLVLLVAGLSMRSRPSAAEALVGDLRAAADGLSAPVDGPRAGEAATRLRGLATTVKLGDDAAAATAGNALLGDLANWRAADELGAPTTDRLRRLVERVPGTSSAAFVATTTTVAPAALVADEDGDQPAHGHGKGHGKKGDD
jgi:hypothetical protein